MTYKKLLASEKKHHDLGISKLYFKCYLTIALTANYIVF